MLVSLLISIIFSLAILKMEGIDDLIEKENKQLQEDNYPCRDVKTEEREVVKDR